MLARFAFAAFTTAMLVHPVAAEPSASAIAGSKDQVKIEVKFVTVADDYFERIGVNYTIHFNGEKIELLDRATEVDKQFGHQPGNAKEPIFLDAKELQKVLESAPRRPAHQLRGCA